MISPYEYQGPLRSPAEHGSKRIDCGAGDDAPVQGAQLQDLVHESCERVRPDYTSWDVALGLPLAKLGAPVVSGATVCRESRCDFPSELRLVPRPGTRRTRPPAVVGTGDERVPPGEPGEARLNRRGRALLRERRRIYVQFVVAPAFPGLRGGFTAELRAP